MEEDLKARKLAKKHRMAQEQQQKSVIEALAARAQLKVEAREKALEEDREKLHEVTWGMAEDAVDPVAQQSEAVQALLGPDGQVDLDKVRQKELSSKQIQLVAK
eukprot:864025-Amphidinium_carterae.1